MRANKLFGEHDIYFLTNRGGINAKRQTEVWLKEFVTHYHTPTVLLTNDVTGINKGLLLRGLGANVFIDDKFENVQKAVEYSPSTHVYLYNRKYNAPIDEAGIVHDCDLQVRRVDTLDDFFAQEGLLS